MSGRYSSRIADGNSSTTPLAAAGALEPTFRAAASAAAAVPAGGGGLTISKPAAVVADDMMVAFIDVNANAATITAPAGWTLIRNDSGNDINCSAYSKRAGGAEPANYEWTFSATPLGKSAAGVISAYVNIVTVGDPIDGHHSGAIEANTNDATVTAPSIAGTDAGSMLVAFFAHTNIGPTWTPPPGMNERVDIQNDAGTFSLADQKFGAGGTTGDRTATLSGFGILETSLGQMVALTPAAAGGGGTFFGVAEEVLDYSALRIVAEADKFGTLDVEFSTDGANWRKTDSFPTVRSTLDPVGETSRSELVPVRARFARVNFRNGSAAQGVFRLQTILVPEADQALARVPERFRVHQAITTVAAGAFTDVLILTGDDKERAIEVVAYGAVPNQPTSNIAAHFPYMMQVSRAGQVVQRTVILNNVDAWQHVRFETSGNEIKIAVMHNELASQSFFAFLNVREP